MAPDDEPAEPATDVVGRLYERYEAAESDAERRAVVRELAALDRQRHAEIYEALGSE